jgi:hypothetical protein
MPLQILSVIIIGRERGSRSRFAKIFFGSGCFSYLPGGSGGFENQDAAVVQMDFLGFRGLALAESFGIGTTIVRLVVMWARRPLSLRIPGTALNSTSATKRPKMTPEERRQMLKPIAELVKELDRMDGKPVRLKLRCQDIADEHIVPDHGDGCLAAKNTGLRSGRAPALTVWTASSELLGRGGLMVVPRPTSLSRATPPLDCLCRGRRNRAPPQGHPLHRSGQRQDPVERSRAESGFRILLVAEGGGGSVDPPVRPHAQIKAPLDEV